MSSRLSLLLISTVITVCAGKQDVVIQGSTYLTDTANFSRDISSITAGQTFVINFLFTDQASNATVGDLLGFCTALRAQGPSQCLYTLQLAPGTLQFAGLLSIPPQPPVNPLSQGLLSVTGGTGLYTGASGYALQTSANTNNTYGPGVPTNGVAISISYG